MNSYPYQNYCYKYCRYFYCWCLLYLEVAIDCGFIIIVIYHMTMEEEEKIRGESKAEDALAIL